MDHVTARLNELVHRGAVSIDCIHKVTGASVHDIQSLLSSRTDGDDGESRLSPIESLDISALSSQLTEGMDITSDERLIGVIDALSSSYDLSLENISQLSAIESSRIRFFIESGGKGLQAEEKFSLGMKAYFLLLTFTQYSID